MMFSNILIISTMTIQGKGLSKGISEGMSPQAAHDDMVASFGLTWLLSGTALGHIGERRRLRIRVTGRGGVRAFPSPRTHVLRFAVAVAVGAGAILGCSAGGWF